MNEKHSAPERMYYVEAGVYYLTQKEGALKWERGAENALLFHSSKEAEELLSTLDYEGTVVPLLHLCVATYELACETAECAVYMLTSSIGVAEGWKEVNNFLVFTPQNIEGINTFLNMGGVILLPRFNFSLSQYAKMYQL